MRLGGALLFRVLMISLGFSVNFSVLAQSGEDDFLPAVDLPIELKPENYDELLKSTCYIKAYDEGSVSTGTGVLVGNTKNDGSLYVLTAAHNLPGYDDHTDKLTKTVVDMNDELEDYEFYFEYYEPNNLGSFITGAVIETLYWENVELTDGGAIQDEPIDLVLLRLLEEPSAEDFDLYFVGWEVTPMLSETVDFTMIQHPLDYAKKVSKIIEVERKILRKRLTQGETLKWLDDGDILITVDRDQSGYKEVNNVMGLPEEGSSGSPLFNEDGLLVGIYTEEFDDRDIFATFVNDLWRNNPYQYDNRDWRPLSEILDPLNYDPFYIDGREYCDLGVEGMTLDEQSRYRRTMVIDEDLNNKVGSITAQDQIDIKAIVREKNKLAIKAREVILSEGAEIFSGATVEITSGGMNGIGCVTGCYSIEVIDAGQVSEDLGTVYVEAKRVKQVSSIEITKPDGTTQIISGPREVSPRYERVNLFELKEIEGELLAGAYEVSVRLSNECDEKVMNGTVTISSGSIEHSNDYHTYAEAVLGEDTYLLNKESMLSHFSGDMGHSFSSAEKLSLFVDVESDVTYATAFGLDGGFNESSIAGDLLFFLDDFSIYSDIRETQFGLDHAADLGGVYDYHSVTMDVYYPRLGQNFGGFTPPALPLVIYIPTGSYLLEADKSMTKEVCRWLASKGYVVASLHTRKGMSVTNGELTKRAMYREWQDVRAAVQYWQSRPIASGKWQIDLEKIYTMGHGSGAISALNNALLTQEVYDAEKADFLKPCTGDFSFTTLAEDIVLNAVTGEMANELKDLEKEVKDFCTNVDELKKLEKALHVLFPDEGINEEMSCSDLVNRFESLLGDELGFTTYDLASYPTYPCIGAGSDPCVLTEAEKSALVNREARATKVVSLSGAIPKLEWLDQLTDNDISIRAIHHENDEVISVKEGEPFGNFLYLLEEADWFINSATEYPRYFGSKLQQDYTGDLDMWLKLEGEWQSGGLPYHHYPQAKFGWQYERGAGFEPRLEQKVLFYADAFYLKEVGDGTQQRAEGLPDEGTGHSSGAEAWSSVLYPNPAAAGQVNLRFETRRTGPVTVALTDMQGKTLKEFEFQFEQGPQEATLDLTGITAGIYHLRLSGSGVDLVEKLMIEK